MKNKIFFKRKKMGTYWKNSKVWGKGRKGNETTALPLLGSRDAHKRNRRGGRNGAGRGREDAPRGQGVIVTVDFHLEVTMLNLVRM